MRITFIGTSSGLTVIDRSHAALLVEFPGYRVLVDCGEGSIRSMLRLNFDPLKINSIVISHKHPDHCAGIPTLMQYMHLKGREDELNIFIPAPLAEVFQAFYNQMFLIDGKLTYGYRFIEYREGTVFKGSMFSMKSIPNRHLEVYSQYIDKHKIFISSFSLVFDEDGKRVYYSADLMNEDDLQPPEEAELMIVESTHVALEEAIERARDFNINHIIFTHIGPEVDTAVDTEYNGVRVEFALDGFSLDI